MQQLADAALMQLDAKLRAIFRRRSLRRQRTTPSVSRSGPERHRYNAEGIVGLFDRPHGGGARRAN